MKNNTHASGVSAFMDAGADEALDLAVSLPDEVDTSEAFLKWAREEAGVDAQPINLSVGSQWRMAPGLNLVRIVDQNDQEVTVEFEMTGQKQVLDKNDFLDKFTPSEETS